MIILGLESSCDDTAAAVLVDGQLKSSVISSQLEHVAWGGVVPEIASRAHLRMIVPVVEQALREAGVSRFHLDAVAVTYGPGLAGALHVGVSFGKTFAAALGIPVYGVNHLEGHLYSVFLENPAPPFPFLCLLVSGGHTELIAVKGPFRHTRLGGTRDDAAGEAFDKVGKMLGLPYPAGPHIDRLAAQGNPKAFAFPRTHLDAFQFSFSGIKTALRYFLEEHGEAFAQAHLADICASFQAAVVDMLVRGVRQALTHTEFAHLAVTGGVSANVGLRKALAAVCAMEDVALYVPSPRYCTDNAAMVAMVGHFLIREKRASDLTLCASPQIPFTSPA